MKLCCITSIGVAEPVKHNSLSETHPWSQVKSGFSGASLAADALEQSVSSSPSPGTSGRRWRLMGASTAPMEVSRALGPVDVRPRATIHPQRRLVGSFAPFRTLAHVRRSMTRGTASSSLPRINHNDRTSLSTSHAVCNVSKCATQWSVLKRFVYLLNT